MTYTTDWQAGWRGWCNISGPDASLEGVQMAAAYQAGYNAAAMANEAGGSRPEAHEAAEESIYTGHWASQVAKSSNPPEVTLKEVREWMAAVKVGEDPLGALQDAQLYEDAP